MSRIMDTIESAKANSYEGVLGFKLSSGEFIVATVIADQLVTPYQIVITPNGLAFYPWLFSNSNKIDLRNLEPFIMVAVPMDKNIVDQYLQDTGQRLVKVPPSAEQRLIVN